MKVIRITIDLEKNSNVENNVCRPIYSAFDFYVIADDNIDNIKEIIRRALKQQQLEILCVTTQQYDNFSGKISNVNDILQCIQNYKSQGFTLVELVVLVVILAIVGTLVFKMIHRFLM